MCYVSYNTNVSETCWFLNQNIFCIYCKDNCGVKKIIIILGLAETKFRSVQIS